MRVAHRLHFQRRVRYKQHFRCILLRNSPQLSKSAFHARITPHENSFHLHSAHDIPIPTQRHLDRIPQRLRCLAHVSSHQTPYFSPTSFKNVRNRRSRQSTISKSPFTPVTSVNPAGGKWGFQRDSIPLAGGSKGDAVPLSVLRGRKADPNSPEADPPSCGADWSESEPESSPSTAAS